MAGAFRLQLEDFANTAGFRWYGDGSSYGTDGGFAYLDPDSNGAAATRFSGPSGVYDVRVHYVAEAVSGSSAFLLDINGTNDQSDVFFSATSRSGPQPASYMTHDNVRLDPGDILTLHARSSGEQHAAVDYIEFIPVEQAQPTPPSNPAPPPSSGDSASTLDAFEQEVLALTNAVRSQAGLAPLRHDPALATAADKHSTDMALKNYFSHVEPDGDRLSDRIRDEGYSFRTAGENIAAGYDTPEAVVAAWLNSSGHRANILNASYTEIGIGFYRDTPEDRYDEYWTQVFAAPSDIA
jgi:uncharacterized protein YkwD